MRSTRLSKQTLRGLLSASLMTLLLLSGCGVLPQKPSPPAVPDPVAYADPITVDTPAYPLTNESWTKWTNALLNALSLANDDRASVKAWADKILKGE